MPLTENEELWYKNQIKKYDPKGEYIVIDDSTGLITYTSKLKSDEKKIKREKSRRIRACSNIMYVV